jgi:2-polyprenyl-3-methyl-5-hydroxy-6-metoxy-1,4-benzoquinol methylase
MNNPLSEYWGRHYTERHADKALGDAQRLDFSNERLRFQTYGMILEAVGPVPDRRCLDAGCGLGDIARLLAFLNGRVSAFDLVEDTIKRLRVEYPQIDWFCADLEQPPAAEAIGLFAIVVACEVLQYVDLNSAITALWRLVAPGGRLVGVVPNAACPIVQRAQARFENHYKGSSLGDLSTLASRLPEVAEWSWRGAYFLEDQSIVPYGLTAWSKEPAGDGGKVPNRLQFVLVRQAATPAPA